MAQIKKWKVGISTQSATTTYVYVDAPTSHDALKIAKMQYPNAKGYQSPFEVKQ